MSNQLAYTIWGCMQERVYKTLNIHSAGVQSCNGATVSRETTVQEYTIAR